MNLIETIKDCKTSSDLYKAINLYFFIHSINDKWSKVLVNRLKKENKFNNSLQLVYDYILNSEHPMKKEKMMYVPHKGSAIGGMECHSPRS